MCLPEKSRFCLACLTFYLLSWIPSEGYTKVTTEPSTYADVRDHSISTHIHDHEDREIYRGQPEVKRNVKEREFYIKVLFNKYGKNGSLTLEGLNTLLENLGVKHQEHNLDKAELEKDHDHDVRGEGKDVTHEHDYMEKSTVGNTRKRRAASYPHSHHTECVTCPVKLLRAYHYSENSTISAEMFTDLCPAIITSIDRTLCDVKAMRLNHTDHTDHSHAAEEKLKNSAAEISGEVWGYSIVSVIMISLVGLLGVAVIPIMQKVFYNHLLQFLVALAVGALSGDALLHLIPHAFGGGVHNHDTHSEHSVKESQEGVYKGLCGLSGIYLFFVMERLLTIFTESKKRKKRKSRLSKSASHGLETTSKSLNSPDEHDCETAMLAIHPAGRALDKYAKESQRELGILNEEDQNLNHNASVFGSADEMDTKRHHGHSHHRKSVPKTVASIAWMVILGDGIHNLSDGLAIGAAYSNSIAGGISTSIAVFCHELPHEIGDFAVLLRAGMTVKQALVYNCVSSILAFLGMVIGLVIGNIGSASLWVFAVTGGMFLYIALVDMMPEITGVDTKKGENHFCHLVLQLSGMMLGAGIMFIIAIFEHELMTLLDF